MDIKLTQIENLKKIEKNILETFKSHIIFIWLFLGLSLLMYAGYIFYFKIYISLATIPSPVVKTQIAQKGQLNQILQDLNEREQKRNSFDVQKLINPFKIK